METQKKLCKRKIFGSGGKPSLSYPPRYHLGNYERIGRFTESKQ
jgi:hypothetical protein